MQVGAFAIDRWGFYFLLKESAKMFEKKKACNKCRKKKPFKDFFKNKGCKDGYLPKCKICSKAYQTSEKGKEVQERYRRSDKRRESLNRYNRSDKARQNRKRYNQSKKGQQASRKDVVIRRTRKTQAGGSYTTDEWYNLCKYYEFCCLKCNKQFPFKKLTIDHIKPVSKGGASSIYNIQPLCIKCNKHKGTKEIDYRQTLPDWIKRERENYHQLSLF